MAAVYTAIALPPAIFSLNTVRETRRALSERTVVKSAKNGSVLTNQARGLTSMARTSCAFSFTTYRGLTTDRKHSPRLFSNARTSRGRLSLRGTVVCRPRMDVDTVMFQPWRVFSSFIIRRNTRPCGASSRMPFHAMYRCIISCRSTVCNSRSVQS